MIRKIKFAVLFLFIVSPLLFSCKSETDKNSDITIKVHEQQTDGGNIIQIPEFICENEETLDNLWNLEKETKELEKIVEKEQKRGGEMEMRSYVSGTDAYPQVTVIWYVDEEESRFYNLMTLAADTREGMPITCKEALLRTQMTGVDLSLQVGKLFNESGERGELQSTEMQGFELGEEGDVREIYMKLTLVTEENGEEKIEEHFFSYILQEKQLIRLSEKGFDVP